MARFKSPHSSITVLTLAGIVSAALAGCNHDPLQKVQVTGTVTFDGGACPESGRVTFSPLEVAEGLPNRPASGSFGKDGKYRVYSFRPGDGVVPGRYSVSVSCFDPSKVSSVPNDAEILAASYVGHSFEPQELMIEAGSGTVTHDFDVPLRQPKKLRR